MIEKLYKNDFRPVDGYTTAELALLTQLNDYVFKMSLGGDNIDHADRMTMLEYAQDIECLSLDVSMADLAMNGVKLERSRHHDLLMIEHTADLIFPESFRDLSLCLYKTGSFL